MRTLSLYIEWREIASKTKEQCPRFSTLVEVKDESLAFPSHKWNSMLVSSGAPLSVYKSSFETLHLYDLSFVPVYRFQKKSHISFVTFTN